MRLLWLVVVAAILAVNWYYIQSFHAVANELRVLRGAVERGVGESFGYTVAADPIKRIKGDLFSAYSAVNDALHASTNS